MRKLSQEEAYQLDSRRNATSSADQASSMTLTSEEHGVEDLMKEHGPRHLKDWTDFPD